MESIHKELKKSSSRSKKVKNLEEEVEFIFSQDESDEDNDVKVIKEEILHKTPSRRTRAKEVETTPSANPTVLKEILQTPRRSCRKSIKPTQDYDDIINKSLRSSTRSAKKHLITTDEADEEDNENVEKLEIEIEVQPKWTPAKVGRVSQKRARKSRRTAKGKKKIEQHDEMEKETEVQEIDTVEDSKEDINEKETEKEIEVLGVSTVDDRHNNEVNNDKETEADNIKIEEVSKVGMESFEISEDKELKAEVNKEEENLENKIKIEQNLAEQENVKEAITQNEINESGGNSKEIAVMKEADNTEISEDEPLNLQQEDTEDVKNVEEKPQDICSSKTISYNDSPRKQELEDSFGSYLKSKEINISDLGLNPLKDEEEDKEVLRYEVKQDIEEMPSLIVCDDEDEDEQMKDLTDTNSNNKLNETFEANDSIEIIEECKENLEKTEEPMETLQLSDDEDNGETPRKCSHIILTDEHSCQTILSTPTGSSTKSFTGSAIRTNIPGTPKALTLTPSLPSTPKQSAKAFRFPTPYRNRNNFNFTNDTKANATRKTPNKNLANSSMISVTTMEPKEVVLRGIRKRSLSVCIDGNDQARKNFLAAGPLTKVKQDRMVSFYSPANQTTIIDDLDMLIAKSLKKQKPLEGNDKFVTTRRKRSMSFDESMSTSLISKLPRPVVQQTVVNKKASTSKPLARTKLPNFAAIHEKQFKKMENLVDHISRKQERSKNLINSATKLRPVSAQKNVSLIKNSNNITTEKPKALKKIDMGTTSSQINKSLLNTTSTSSLNRTLEQNSTKLLSNLPDPRMVVNKPFKSVATNSSRAPQQQSINKYLKPSQTLNIEKSRLNTKTIQTNTKPAFNLSTSLMVKASSSTTSLSEKANTSCLTSNEDKMASRLQRHMDLFKGRVPSTRAGIASRKNEVLLKGVRSNRRFELQMQHRKNMEQ